ncbi:MAG TPA: cupin domain-containing protein [Terriglobales bacterium]|nr:cupin domain-containing protein [Terriglobales bacterium]
MKTLRGGCVVSQVEEHAARTEGTRRFRTAISRAQGAKHVAQTISEYAPGESPVRVNPGAEEVLYCVAGRGSVRIAGRDYPLESGTAAYIPAGAEYSITNSRAEALRVVAVCCPQDDASHVVARPAQSGCGTPPARTVREQERPPIRSGDRHFRLLVDKDLGCRAVTQFVGFIPPSKAPFHFHTYEEAIFILAGAGVVHTQLEGDAVPDSQPFSAGTSIFLPAGCLHCLENPGTEPVRLLGVFYPSGSPSVSYDAGSDH